MHKHTTTRRAVHSSELCNVLEQRLMLSGGFEVDHTTPAGEADRLAFADFDGDGDLDVAAAHGEFGAGLTIFLNNSGTLEIAQEFDYPINNIFSRDVAAADFDNDGDMDVIALGLRLFRNTGGVFAAAEELRQEVVMGGFFVADHDADNFPDIFVQDDSTGEVSLYRNVDGLLAAGEALLRPGDAGLIGVLDMDGDADPDLVYFEQSMVHVYLNDAGSYAAGPSFHVSSDEAPVIGDLNADAIPDLIWADGRHVSALNLGDGSFAPATESGTDDWIAVLAVGDFDADGDADVAGVSSTYFPVGVVVAFADAPGVFAFRVGLVDTYHPSQEQRPSAYAARITGGSRTDLLTITRPGIAPTAGTLTVYRGIAAPEITSFVGPADPYIPGRVLRFDITATRGEASGVAAVTLYRDANSNGVYDASDPLHPYAQRVAPGSDEWVSDPIVGDGGAAGMARFFAIATGDGLIYSDPASVDVEFWTRVFYPEGWRNDATINEYVPIVNPNPFAVEYRLVAHYETGERDVVVAEGTIAAFTRGGVTISEHSNPGGALVRLNEGYALELQSTAFLGAMLSHYDSFTGSAGMSAATGEAFTGSSSTVWYFAEASTEDASFIVIFNPLEVDVDVTFTFYDDDNSFITVTRTIGALRRGGIALRDPALGLAANTPHAVLVSASSAIIAAQSAYSLTDGTGFTALGANSSQSVATDYQIEFRQGLTNRLTLFNTSTSSNQTVSVAISYPGMESPIERFFLLGPLERRVVDLDALSPLNAQYAAIRTSAYTASFIESVDLDRGDSTAASPAAQAATTWAFADGFLDRTTAGAIGYESLSIFNPRDTVTNVTIRFIYPDAFTFDMHITIGAEQSTQLNLHELFDVYGRYPLNFFSVMVYADEPVVANMTHWDLFQGGGWSTLGTPGGTTGPA